jgi:hypothetical protein
MRVDFCKSLAHLREFDHCPLAAPRDGSYRYLVRHSAGHSSDPAVKIPPNTSLSDLQARVKRARPTSAAYSDTLVRSVQQSMRVEGHTVSAEAVDAAAKRVLGDKHSR